MAEVKNSLIKSNGENQKIGAYLTSNAVKNRVNQIIGSEKGERFIASIVSAVSLNPDLQKCDNSTILSGALVGESLGLQPSAFMGQYYLVPFKDNKNDRYVAQFQIGYKGYLQLAIRSGQYKKINVVAIKEGELVSYNPLDEEIVVNIIEDDLARENAKTIGYYAMFELTTGFRKSLYWSKDKMEKHALTFSKGYQAKKGYTFWEKDFDGMAFKTMLRQLISKWGVMSIEMQEAYQKDMAVIKEDDSIEYVDNPNVVDTPRVHININANTGEIVGNESETETENEKETNPFEEVLSEE